MLAAQRKAAILYEVAKAGALKVATLAELLDVSEVTIRRDIDQLDEQGLVAKVHGGVTAKGFSATAEPAFSKTSQREQDSKEAIALEAARIVQPGQAVALMGGSSVFALARAIAHIPGLTVVTNSVPISDYFAREEPTKGWSIVLTGGDRTPTDSLVGPLAEQAFRLFNFDIAFMGTHGMSPSGGFSSPNMFEADINRNVIATSGTVVVLADHTKWNVRGFSSFGPLSSADVLIVDDQLDSSVAKELESQVTKLVLAPTAATTR